MRCWKPELLFEWWSSEKVTLPALGIPSHCNCSHTTKISTFDTRCVQEGHDHTSMETWDDQLWLQEENLFHELAPSLQEWDIYALQWNQLPHRAGYA